jgi:hypothetical protein
MTSENSHVMIQQTIMLCAKGVGFITSKARTDFQMIFLLVHRQRVANSVLDGPLRFLGGVYATFAQVWRFFSLDFVSSIYPLSSPCLKPASPEALTGSSVLQ